MSQLSREMRNWVKETAEILVLVVASVLVSAEESNSYIISTIELKIYAFANMEENSLPDAMHWTRTEVQRT